MKDLKVHTALEALLPKGGKVKIDSAQFTLNVTMPNGSTENEIDAAGKKVMEYLVQNQLDRKMDKRYKHGMRPFSIREYARLQGVPDDYKFPERRSSYRLIGNGVAVPVGKWCGEQAMKYFN